MVHVDSSFWISTFRWKTNLKTIKYIPEFQLKSFQIFKSENCIERNIHCCFYLTHGLSDELVSLVEESHLNKQSLTVIGMQIFFFFFFFLGKNVEDTTLDEPYLSIQMEAEISLIPRCVAPPHLNHYHPPSSSYSCNLRDYKEMKKD